MKKIVIPLIRSFLCVSFIFIYSCDKTEHKINSISDNDVFEFVSKDTTWKKMTLREKIGQTMIINSRIYDQEKFEGRTLDSFFQKYPVGGFFIADWYYNLFYSKDSIAPYIKKSIRKYASSTKYPLIFMEDYERGLGERIPPYTYMPVEMTLGAVNSEQLAYDYGKSIALEARDLGINWLLHPVADLNVHPLNPLVIERAVSDNADTAIPLLKKQLSGLQDQCIIATIKHFPGDGATFRDQHLITASNNLSWKKWKETYGKVFQSLINHGAASIMVGHITLPAYQKVMLNGVLPPATLSEEIILNLLKRDMNFKGVVISDALNMGGATGYYPDQMETSIACFQAGIDMILWPDLSYMDSLESRILRGEIPIERLDDAVQRIWALKERFGLLNKSQGLFTQLSVEDKKFIYSTATTLAENAVTLLKGDSTLLPLSARNAKNLLLVNIGEKDKSEYFIQTKQLLEKKGFHVTLLYGLSFFDWEWRVHDLDQYDRIMVCLENRYMNPVGVSFLKGKEAESVWMTNLLPEEKIIAISYSNPYYLNFYFKNVPVCINAYSSDPYMQEAVVRSLTGEIPFRGISPVILEHDILQ
jgi:beta-N-acetylhexosaminidase